MSSAGIRLAFCDVTLVFNICFLSPPPSRLFDDSQKNEDVEDFLVNLPRALCIRA